MYSDLSYLKMGTHLSSVEFFYLHIVVKENMHGAAWLANRQQSKLCRSIEREKIALTEVDKTAERKWEDVWS
mgnify:CR=1 FL=1